jgi:Ca2+-binding EF-hand superfamily protein
MNLLRSAGHYPTESFLTSLEDVDMFTLGRVKEIATSIPRCMSLKDGFDVFDRKRSGVLPFQALERILKDIGEPLEAPLADEVLAIARQKCLSETGDVRLPLLLSEIESLNSVEKPTY